MGRRFPSVLAVSAVVVAVGLLAGCGGGGSSKQPTAAQLYAQQIQVGTFQESVAGIDPDELDRSGADAVTSVVQLGNGRYDLVVQNTSNVGFINTFAWHAAGLDIKSVTGSSSGTCQVQQGAIINCTGLKMAPPKCTCLPGGKLTVHFVAQPSGPQTAGVHYGLSGAKLRVEDLTPVPYHIPSYQNSQTNIDLPLCAKGQQSTKAHLCVHAT